MKALEFFLAFDDRHGAGFPLRGLATLWRVNASHPYDEKVHTAVRKSVAPRISRGLLRPTIE
jgi:hypothetical protein